MFPLILGSGKRLWDDSAADLAKLALVEHEVYSNGIVKAVYEVVK